MSRHLMMSQLAELHCWPLQHPSKIQLWFRFPRLPQLDERIDVDFQVIPELAMHVWGRFPGNWCNVGLVWQDHCVLPKISESIIVLHTAPWIAQYTHVFLPRQPNSLHKIHHYTLVSSLLHVQYACVYAWLIEGKAILLINHHGLSNPTLIIRLWRSNSL